MKGAKTMRAITGLYIIVILMHFIWLTNFTLLNGEWSGIAMWLSTGLFIGGTAFYLINRKSSVE